MKNKLVVACLLLVSSIYMAKAQKLNNSITVQGAIFATDSLQPKSGVKINVNNLNSFTSNTNGFFSIETKKGDSLYFITETEKIPVVIPDSLRFSRYLMGIFINPGQIATPEIILLPYYLNENLEKELLSVTKTQDEINAKSNLDLLKLQAETGNIGFELYNGPDIAMWQFQNKIVFKGMYGPENSVQLPVLGILGLFYSLTNNALQKEKMEKQITTELKRIKIERDTKKINK